MKKIDEIIKEKKIIIGEIANDGGVGVAYMAGSSEMLRIVFSWGLDWDHVSISLKYRCPKWNEMCWVKDVFFYKNETVIQYHPPEDVYVNNHEYVLHLWKPQNIKIPMPPTFLV
jgi:hypothetical protein